MTAKFPWGPIIAWCAGLALPLGVMGWQQPTSMQATYLLMALTVFHGGDGWLDFLPAIGRRSGGEVRQDDPKLIGVS